MARRWSPTGVARPAQWGVRTRSAAAAGLVIAAAGIVGAIVLLFLLHRSLIGAADAAAAARAHDIVLQLAHDGPSELDPALFATDSRISAVQILDHNGRVQRTSSPEWPDPLLDPAGTSAAAHSAQQPLGADSDLRVVARRATDAAGPETVLVAASTESVESTVADVATLLAIGIPLLVIVGAAANYWLVRRSLASVDAIRARVEHIETTNLSARVPVPAARDEIGRLAETMNAMLARIEAGHTAQRRFISDASHELRSPLATITAAVELARDHPELIDLQLINETMIPETDRMRRLVTDLLTLAAADEHRLALHITDVDIDDLAAGVTSGLRLRNNVAVRTNLQPVRVRGDAEKLARAITNLTDNAEAHAATTVAVTTERTISGARITVDDDGTGIAEVDRGRVFDRFVRLDPDRARSAGGSGLGLAIVAEIVTAHHGEITVTSAPELSGARFVVDLPADAEI
ncbi:HAMP domain-containing protein [Skermania sp. ID1734]|uniref:sensor histidine kinase n=1 Tax=Skermania sp. ID1734 TaxID=2597516 RepID=UPI00117D5D53|nr:ATP-binding protein [Skermania sp. ID1734]TSE01503.1 HAMP domain-containing protein [Skermania sp. ID1734]